VEEVKPIENLFHSCRTIFPKKNAHGFYFEKTDARPIVILSTFWTEEGIGKSMGIALSTD